MSSNDIIMIIIDRISRKSQQTAILIDLRYIQDDQINSKIRCYPWIVLRKQLKSDTWALNRATTILLTQVFWKIR